jgi:4-hydroxy-tetrahydrodipicolinate reductase
MKQPIGIIGNTGRMGRLLTDQINKHPKFITGVGFDHSRTIALEEVFQQNDYVVDFSNSELIEAVLNTAANHHKPLVICTTGWSYNEQLPLIEKIAQKAPVVIASNTSVGAYLQRYLVKQLAKILGEEYDIDISEKHHRHKIDIPSGTAMTLIEDIQAVKKQHHNLSYQAHPLEKGPRPEHFIGVAVERSGNLPGDHEVSFTSLEEKISIRHVAFDRALFARGAIKVLEWLEGTKPAPGIYTMENVLQLL